MNTRCIAKLKTEWVRRGALIAALVAAVCLAVPLSAAADCDANGPHMLSLFLAGREIGNAVHTQVEQKLPQATGALAETKMLFELDAALGQLNTQVWGMYWVTNYSRRLYEVLDQLDSKPPGPVTQYYARWSRAQLTSSATLTMSDVGRVGDALARAKAVSPEQSARLRKYLDDLNQDLQGCTSAP